MARAVPYGLVAVIAATACIAVLAVVYVRPQNQLQGDADELLLKVHLQAHEPYSPPSNMYLWWGPETNHRFVGSGERIRQLFHMGNIEGGEWRDPMFLGNNGVETFASQRFRRISEACCSTIVIPPMEWEFPVFNTHKIIGQRIRNFVANGNTLVLTGGIAALEFINSYFFYNIELVDGNYSPGPFRRLNSVPKQMSFDPKVLPQKGVSVTAVKKATLPSGAEVLWGTPRSSPVFLIKFCEAQSPDEGMPPVKVLPRDCPLAAQDGRPCSCGSIVYIGYNWNEPYPSRWDKVLLSSVELLNPCWSPPPPLPPLEPCSDVPKPKCAANSIPSCPSTGWSGQGAKRAVGPASAPAAATSILRAVSQEQNQIRSLEGEVEQLSASTAARRRRSVDSDEGARVDALASLKSKVSELLDRLSAAGGGRRAARGRRGRSARGGGGEDAVLEKSILSLSDDVRKVDAKVDRLASAVEKARPASNE